MRIVAGEWRGRALAAPPGRDTRPTADRVRQALFDMLLHAPWGGREAVVGARVLDAFAGTGALGLEALSRGAAHAVFVERDRDALRALRANIATCRAEARSTVMPADLLALCPDPGSPPARIARIRAPGAAGLPGSGLSASLDCPDPGRDLLFLDPPYGQDLIPRALARLRASGWIARGALIIAETARDEPLSLPGAPLAERTHGAARLTVWREP